jgi:Uma2 family endonuclease
MITTVDTMPGPVQGHWTHSDYLALPDNGKRYEIVNGVLYMSPSPSIWHQNAVLQLALYIKQYITSHQLGKVFIAPLDVELDFKTVVQPDILVVLNENSSVITDNGIVGAPNLVIEVASPGTTSYDRNQKLNLYERAGIQEYWIVDVMAHTIEVLVRHDGKYRARGVFQGKSQLPSQVLAGFSMRVEQVFE